MIIYPFVIKKHSKNFTNNCFIGSKVTGVVKSLSVNKKNINDITWKQLNGVNGALMGVTFPRTSLIYYGRNKSYHFTNF